MKLSELVAHFFVLYGRRNRIFLPSLRGRIDFLNLAIGDLQEAVRKEAGKEILGMALARIVSRIFCVAEHFHELPFVEVLARKYPMGHCSYCQQYPCQCAEKRPDLLLSVSPSREQLEWGISDWSEHLGDLYGPRNTQRGIEYVINRLFKEVSELLSCSLLIVNAPTESTLDQIEEAYALELADALAWTIAVANLLGVDLEQATLKRFGNRCWHCCACPCCCAHFSVKPVDWSAVM